MNIKLKQNETLSVSTSSGGAAIVPDVPSGETKILATVDQLEDLSNDIVADINDRLVVVEGQIDDLSNDVYSAIDDLSNDLASHTHDRLVSEYKDTRVIAADNGAAYIEQDKLGALIVNLTAGTFTGYGTLTLPDDVVVDMTGAARVDNRYVRTIDGIDYWYVFDGNPEHGRQFVVGHYYEFDITNWESRTPSITFNDAHASYTGTATASTLHTIEKRIATTDQIQHVDIVSPTTDGSGSGKAADANATGLALELTQVFSEWTPVPNTYNGLPVFIAKDDGKWAPWVKEGEQGPYRKIGIDIDDSGQLHLEWPDGYAAIPLVADRSVIGYTLGDQDTKQLAAVSVNDRVDDLSEDVSSLDSKIDDLSNDIDSRLDDLSNGIVNLRQKDEELEGSIDDLSNDIHSMQSDRIVSENGVTTVKAENDRRATISVSELGNPVVTFYDGFGVKNTNTGEWVFTVDGADLSIEFVECEHDGRTYYLPSDVDPSSYDWSRMPGWYILVPGNSGTLSYGSTSYEDMIGQINTSSPTISHYHGSYRGTLPTISREAPFVKTIATVDQVDSLINGLSDDVYSAIEDLSNDLHSEMDALSNSVDSRLDDFSNDFVRSVNGQHGDVSLDATNLYMDPSNDVSIAEAIASIPGGGGIQSVNGDTGPDVRLDATNLYMDSNDQVTIAEAIENIPSGGGITSINGDTGPDVRLDATNLYMDSNDQVTIAEAISHSAGAVSSVNGDVGDVWLYGSNIPMSSGSPSYTVSSAIADLSNDIDEIIDDLSNDFVRSVNGVSGPDVRLDATNIYMDLSNDVSIAEAVEENSHEIHSESGYNSIGFNTDGDAVIRSVDFNNGAFAHFHDGYQVSYNGITYTAQEDVDIELVGPYYRNIDSAEYYFWVPSSVDDPENFNPFDQSTSPVWYLWTQKVAGEEWTYIPQFMSYANGPQFVVNNWNSENPDTSCIAGTESGEHFRLSRTRIITTLLIANKSEIAYPGTNIPSMDDGNGSIGTSNEYSRSDHIHPSDVKKVSQGDVYSAKILHDGTVKLYQDPFYYESETGIDPNGDSITIPLSSRVHMGGVFFSIISSLELASLPPGSSTSANLTIFYYSYDAAPGSEPYYGKHILMDAEVSVYSTSATIYQLTLSNINEIGVDANNIAFDQTSAYNYIFSGSAKILDYRFTEGYFLVDFGTLDWISGGSSSNTVISIPEVKTLATEKYVDDAISGISGTVISVNGDSGVVVLDADDIMMGYDSNDITIAEAIGGLDDRIGDIDSVLDAINGEVI